MMRLFLILLLTAGVGGYKFDPESFKLIQEDPLNANFVNQYTKPKLGINIYTNESLPHDVVVHSYDISIEPFFAFKDFKFDKQLLNTLNGAVTITFSVLSPTASIELASSVVIQESSLKLKNKYLHITQLVKGNKDHLNLRTREVLLPNKNYTLHFRYHVNTSDVYHGGVYTYNYMDKDNQITSLMATIFETVYARELLPCFDDLFFKSTFTLTIIHPKGAKVYSNSEIDSQHEFDEQRYLTRFKETPKMSTYLLAFAIGDFAERHAVSASGVKIGAMAINNLERFIEDAAKTGAHCVDAMENLVRVNYPLSKLDHLDTVQFSAGGMENFGLIIYGNFVPEQVGTSIAERYSRKSVICHETAHQWFGDLVTAERWGWEFLHESFADYFQAKIVGQMNEFKQYAEESTVAVTLYAVGQANYATHPIADNVSHFDRITYQVGGAVLNSIRHVLGDDVFYKGLHTYQVENAYGNARLETLLKSWSKHMDTEYLCGDLTFTDYASDYFLQTGIPQININLTSTKEYELTQLLFENSTTWNVPVFILDLDTNKEHVMWLLKDGGMCHTEHFALKPEGRYMFNNDAKTFANFDIDDILWKRVYVHDKYTQLSVHNQYYLLHYLSTIKKQYPVANGLIHKTVKANKGKTYPVTLGFLWSHGENYNETLRLLSDAFDYEPTPSNRLLGSYFLERAVNVGIDSVVKKTQEYFDQFKVDCGYGKDAFECTKLTPEFRRAVYFQGAKDPEGKKLLRDYHYRILAHKYSEQMKSELYRTGFF
ncbi:unnamed protein product [Bursaphelenchus okinawaensis]|uniref:Aminopeptidase n=1 Tax=Bursaphelenchus okinawaensis TaxID=465554 RepID=A0A811JR46_9BILA|nr:unnamed protein product [Bursaphelenchus okinawaensis]CAG9079092.1 unnamed protein product [Bursaphelenchus okinawaensis]